MISTPVRLPDELNGAIDQPDNSMLYRACSIPASNTIIEPGLRHRLLLRKLRADPLDGGKGRRVLIRPLRKDVITSDPGFQIQAIECGQQVGTKSCQPDRDT